MLDNLLRDKDFLHIFADVETCSVNLCNLDNKCWQLAMLICQGSKILEGHRYFLRWEPLLISDGAARVTKFNRIEYEQKAIDPRPILDFFESYLYNPKYRILGHNILGFDIYLHNIWRKSYGLKSDYSYLNRVIDTDCLARGLKNDYKYKPGDDFLAYQYRAGSIIKKGCKTNLTALGKEYKVEDINYDNLHSDALEDLRLNKKVWEKMKFEVEI